MTIVFVYWFLSFSLPFTLLPYICELNAKVIRKTSEMRKRKGQHKSRAGRQNVVFSFSLRRSLSSSLSPSFPYKFTNLQICKFCKTRNFGEALRENFFLFLIFFPPPFFIPLLTKIYSPRNFGEISHKIKEGFGEYRCKDPTCRSAGS